MSPNYLSEQELSTIKGLLHYFNANIPQNEGVGVEARLIDSNGEALGKIVWNAEPGAGYVLEFPNA